MCVIFTVIADNSLKTYCQANISALTKIETVYEFVVVVISIPVDGSDIKRPNTTVSIFKIVITELFIIFCSEKLHKNIPSTRRDLD